MAYIGRAPTSGTFLKQDITSDGSTTTFTLQNTVGNESALLVSVGGVIQEPKVAYTLATGGTQIVFSTAPSATDNVYIHFLGNSVTQNLNNVRGSEFILDADGDTSFTADTDDEIDIQVGGTDRSTIKTTGFHNIDSYKFVAGTGDDLEIYHDGTNSFIANKTGALKLATETSGIAITIGHSTSEVTIADNATVAGNLTVTGTLTQTGTQTFDGGIDVDNFNINGTTIALSTGDMILDSAGDIILDVDGADILFKDDGTTYGSLTNTSGNLIIKSGTTTAATFAGANVTFAGTIDSGAITSTGVVTATGFTIGSAVITETELEILDGLAATTAELAVIDGGTSATATTVAAADRVVLNDNGTMVQAAVTDLDTFFSASSKTLTNKTLTSPVINTGTFGTSILPTSADGTTLGSASKEFADLFLADASTIQFGADQDVIITHVADTGLLLSGTNVIQFNDASQNIGAPSATVLDINATDEIELNATLVDVNANADISGTLTLGGNLIVGSATVTEAQLEILDGATVTTTELNLIDGGATVGTTAIADGDGLLINDAGTMRVSTVQTLAAYLDDEITVMPNLATTAALVTVGAAGTATSLAGIPFYQGDTGSIYTHDVSGTDSTALGNTAYGLQALDAVTTGDYNTAIGYQALSAQSEGEGNVAVGQAALNANTTAGNNLAVGKSALLANTTGTRNIAIGNRTNDLADTENDNLAIGYEAMTGAVAGGEYNVAIGNYALDALTSGDQSVAIGYEAGSGTQSGRVLAVGYQAAKGNTSGGGIIAIGDSAYVQADTENYNLAIGQEAMTGAVAGGEYNTAVGHFSLDALTSADYITAVGYGAGSAVTTGGYNTLIGYQAGLAMTNADGNIAIGHEALVTNTLADRNIAIGYRALATMDIASKGDVGNIAVGWDAGSAITTGTNNLVIGAEGGESITENSYNTIIGTHANTKNDNTSDEYQIALGYDCMSVGSNFFTFGKGTGNDRVYNGFTSNASWTRVSDERYKKDIQDNTDCGLNFINDLRPVTFKWKEKSELDTSFPDYDAEINNDAHPNKLYGLIAQEVKEALDKNNITDFGGWSSITTGEHTQQGVSQEMFIHPLIKAVQELSAQVTTLQDEIKTLKDK